MLYNSYLKKISFNVQNIFLAIAILINSYFFFEKIFEFVFIIISIIILKYSTCINFLILFFFDTYHKTLKFLFHQIYLYHLKN